MKQTINLIVFKTHYRGKYPHLKWAAIATYSLNLLTIAKKHHNAFMVGEGVFSECDVRMGSFLDLVWVVSSVRKTIRGVSYIIFDGFGC